MSLMSLHDISISYGSNLLLDNISLHLQPGEKVALLGRNGCGKSTLLKIIARIEKPDEGRISCRKNLNIQYLPQEISLEFSGANFGIISQGLENDLHLVKEYHRINSQLEKTLDQDLIRKLDLLNQKIENRGAWEVSRKIDALIKTMRINPGASFETLSAGEKRRVLLAKCLVSSPDILLLDEPTNHMDVTTIIGLEKYIKDFTGTLVLVTHDRVLVQKLANRIIEIDRGKLLDWRGDYRTFLKKKEELLKAESWAEKIFDKNLAKEEIWIRQGIKARRTRNEGRVKALKKMREIRCRRRRPEGKVKLGHHQAELSGKQVIQARDISYSYRDSPLIKPFSLTLMRGDKVGIIGPNGCGKTTLLRILTGNLKPDRGEIRFGTHLKTAYFDQLRDQLDNHKSAKENIVSGAGNEIILFNGKQRHVYGYLQDFLFTPDRANTRIDVFSGGERNRLLLAKILANPSNLLVLDEPTNDLDIETLELLEEFLLDYNGTILLVSHDRAFLNNVVTSSLVFEGGGKVTEYLGEFSNWHIFDSDHRPERGSGTGEKKKQQSFGGFKKLEKLTFNEERELNALPDKIEKLETRREWIYRTMSSPDFYKSPGAEIQALKKELSTLEAELENAYRRWDYLESKKR